MKILKLLVDIFYYYFLIGSAFSLILYDFVAIHKNQANTTLICLVINLIILTWVFYLLFMRNKNESSLFEKIVLVILLLITIIGSMIVILKTNFLFT